MSSRSAELYIPVCGLCRFTEVHGMCYPAENLFVCTGKSMLLYLNYLNLFIYLSIYLIGDLRRTQECFLYTTAASLWSEENRRGVNLQPFAGCWKTFPFANYLNAVLKLNNQILLLFSLTFCYRIQLHGFNQNLVHYVYLFILSGKDFETGQFTSADMRMKSSHHPW